MIAIEEATQGFAAVGSEPRMEVLLTLVAAGPSGLGFGDIQSRTDIPASTLSHHLRFLSAAGLVLQERQGRQTISRPDFERLEALSAFILHKCCVDCGHTASVEKIAEPCCADDCCEEPALVS